MTAKVNSAAIVPEENYFVPRKNKVSFLQLDTVVIHNTSTPLDTTASIDLSAEQFELLLLKFFKISYYLGITPYYLHQVTLQDGKNKVETLPSRKIHTAFVVFVHACTTLRCVMLFTLLSYNLKNPLNYFEIARTFLSSALCWFFIWSLWMKHSICKRVLCHLSNLRYFPNVTMFKLKWVENTVLAISLLLLYTTSVYPAMKECNLRIDIFCQQEHHLGKSKLCQVVTDNAHWRYGKVVGRVLFVFCNFLGYTTRRFPRMKLLIISLSLWQCCKSFGKSIKEKSRAKQRQNDNYKPHEIKEILDAYEELKEITILIRRLIGNMLVTEIVEDILYFSLEVQLRLKKGDWFNIFVVFETWMVAFMAYFIAACAAEPIQELSIWIGRDDVLSQLSPGKVSTIHNQLNANPIGLKGGSLFTITKTFLANVVTVWLTYFIILLQFQTTYFT